MDNVSFYKQSDIQQAILDVGHILEYLPPYSSDLNPIERKWAQSKAIRKQKNCTIDEIFCRWYFIIILWCVSYNYGELWVNLGKNQ